MLLVCRTGSAWPGKIKRHMVTLTYTHIHKCGVCKSERECALYSSKQRSESAGSLGNANLAMADGCKLIRAKKLWSASE